MQKKLLALAVVAAISAPAFAADDSKVSVSVYGILDVGLGNESKTVTVSSSPLSTNPGSTTKYTQTALEYSALTSSRLGFLAGEEMADGTKATVKVETGIGSNPMAGYSQTGASAPTANGTTIDATSLGNRELNLTLAFTEGTSIKAGYGSTPIRDISLGYAADPGGNLVGNVLNNDATLGSNRFVTLDAIQQFGAVKGTFGLIKDRTSIDTTNTVAATGVTNTISSAIDTKGYQLAAQYNQDALSASVAFQNTFINNDGNNTANTATSVAATASNHTSQKIMILGGSFDLGVAKLFGEYASINNSGLVYNTATNGAGVTTVAGASTSWIAGTGKRTYLSVGAQAPVGQAVVFGQISTGTVDRATANGGYIPFGGATAVASESRKISGLTLGAKYNMSKATYAYASYGNTNLKAGSSDPATAGVKVSQIALGLVHSF